MKLRSPPHSPLDACSTPRPILSGARPTQSVARSTLPTTRPTLSGAHPTPPSTHLYKNVLLARCRKSMETGTQQKGDYCGYSIST